MQISEQTTRKHIGIWLLTGVIMIIIQIALGGITRLTGSGLSITEWKPIMGSIPPLNEVEWLETFKKYQQIAQYKHLNSHFSLSDFKSIFFWEWMHRLWGRLLGIVFLIPFVIFLFQGKLSKKTTWPLVTLFLLGGLQGVIGWIMVESGLNQTNLYVSHIRLAIHFVAAMILLVYNFWLALKFLIPKTELRYSAKPWRFAFIITGLLGVQLIFGAFMAGLKAGVYAPTWPDINGAFFPTLSQSTSWLNDPITIHFIHRNLAYLIVILILMWTLKYGKIQKGEFRSAAFLPMILVFLQVALGVFATIYSYKAVSQVWGIFEWMAQMHQIIAILLLLSLTFNIYILRKSQE